jgi:hypothetical protein
MQLLFSSCRADPQAHSTSYLLEARRKDEKIISNDMIVLHQGQSEHILYPRK